MMRCIYFIYLTFSTEIVPLLKFKDWTYKGPIPFIEEAEEDVPTLWKFHLVRYDEFRSYQNQILPTWAFLSLRGPLTFKTESWE